MSLRVAATVAVYNEEEGLPLLIEALLAQTRPLDQIVIVDDGSRDHTYAILKDYASRYPQIVALTQTNKGPATARNKAWRAAEADICAFTDGDCVPEPDWVEKIVAPFADPAIGAVGGAYRTLNTENVLAHFIGTEIDWRYRNVSGRIQAHGTYSLAVRKSALEEIGGFNEAYPKPSGEDFDLTYKISRSHHIVFAPNARVGTSHPEELWTYLKIQSRRAFDRIHLYNEHPEQSHSDNYTEATVKYQILGALALLPCALAALFDARAVWLIAALLAFLLLCGSSLFLYQWKHSPRVAIAGIGISFLRNYAWGAGLLAGLFRFGLSPLLLGQSLFRRQAAK